VVLVLHFVALGKSNHCTKPNHIDSVQGYCMECREWDGVVLRCAAQAKPNHYAKPNHIDSVQGYLKCREWDVVVLRFVAQANPNHCAKPNHIDSEQGYLKCRECDVVVLRFVAQAKRNHCTKPNHIDSICAGLPGVPGVGCCGATLCGTSQTKPCDCVVQERAPQSVTPLGIEQK
jgi:hypothetical protein